MRVDLRSLSCLLTVALLASCGGDDSNDPEDPFPDAAGAYEMSGGFDGIPAGDGSFEGTLELTQASQGTGTLQGSASIVADIGGEVFNIADDALSNASVSPSGVLAFTMTDASGSWTFTGTLSASSITEGRHTISDGDQSLSGTWQGTRVSGGIVTTTKRYPSLGLGQLVRRLPR